MADNVLQQLPGFSALMADQPEVSEAVLSDPAIQNLLTRLQTSPEEIHRQREAQRLGSGQKGFGAKLKGILGILEAAGSGFVGQPSIGDRNRAAIYEEYKTMAPFLERQLEAGIRNRSAIEKNRVELLKTAAKYTVDAEKAFQAGRLTQEQVEKFKAEVGRITALKDLTEQKTKFEELRARYMDRFGTDKLPTDAVMANLASGQSLEGGQAINPERFNEGLAKASVGQNFSKLLGIAMGGGRGGSGGGTTITQGTRLVRTPTGPFTETMQAFPVTTQTTRVPAGGGSNDPVSLKLREGFLGKGLDFLKRREASALPATSPDETPTPAQIEQIKKQAPKKGIPALPVPVMKEVAKAQGIKAPAPPPAPNSRTTAPGSPGVFYTKDYFKQKEAANNAVQSAHNVFAQLNDYVFTPGARPMFGRFFGGRLGSGTVWAEDLNNLRHKATSQKVALNTAMTEQAWKYIKEMSGLAVTQKEWEVLEDMVPTTARNVESGWMRAAVFSLGADLARLRMALPDEEDRKAVGLSDRDLIFNMYAYMREMYDGNPRRGLRGVKQDVAEIHDSGVADPDAARYYRNKLTMAEVMKRFYPEKYAELVKRLPDEGGTQTTIKIPAGGRR